MSTNNDYLFATQVLSFTILGWWDIEDNTNSNTLVLTVANSEAKIAHFVEKTNRRIICTTSFFNNATRSSTAKPVPVHHSTWNTQYCNWLKKRPRQHRDTSSSSPKKHEIQTKTFANPSAPALAIYGRLGWNATSYMASSNFFRCEVISCTQVLVSRFQRRIEQSWPKERGKYESCGKWFQHWGLLVKVETKHYTARNFRDVHRYGKGGSYLNLEAIIKGSGRWIKRLSATILLLTHKILRGEINMESKPQKRNWKSCCALSRIRGNNLKITFKDVTSFNPIESETLVNGFCPLWLGILINSLRCFEFLSIWICYLINEIEFNCMTQPPRSVCLHYAAIIHFTFGPTDCETFKRNWSKKWSCCETNLTVFHK